MLGAHALKEGEKQRGEVAREKKDCSRLHSSFSSTRFFPLRFSFLQTLLRLFFLSLLVFLGLMHLDRKTCVPLHT